MERLVCELVEFANAAKLDNARACCLGCVSEVDALLAAMSYNVSLLKMSVAALCGTCALTEIEVPADFAPAISVDSPGSLFPPLDSAPAMIEMPNLNPPAQSNPTTVWKSCRNPIPCPRPPRSRSSPPINQCIAPSSSAKNAFWIRPCIA